MTYGAFTSRDFAPFDLAPVRRRPPVIQPLLCATMVVLSVSAGALLLFSRPPVATQPVLAVAVVPAAPTRAAVLPAAALPALRREASLLDPTLTTSQHAVAFALNAPLRSMFDPRRIGEPDASATASAPQTAERTASAPVSAAPARPASPTATPPDPAEIAQDVPLPAPRPVLLSTNEARLSGPRHVAALPQPTAPLAPTPDRPGFFEKLFGRPPTTGPALAYAAPEDGGVAGLLAGRRPAADGATAVYDIAAHTVYLPDGTRLEAHSGIGLRKDDPRSVTEHMRGATPPNVYNLSFREAPFHGVRALRLTPTSGTTYGRAGLLAHTYMLGPNGDSNGCVVFRDYRTFLAAFERGQIRQLAVVARMN